MCFIQKVTCLLNPRTMWTVRERERCMGVMIHQRKWRTQKTMELKNQKKHLVTTTKCPFQKKKTYAYNHKGKLQSHPLETYKTSTHILSNKHYSPPPPPPPQTCNHTHRFVSNSHLYRIHPNESE